MRIPKTTQPCNHADFRDGYRLSMLRSIISTAEDAMKSESCAFHKESLRELVRFCNYGIEVEVEE